MVRRASRRGSNTPQGQPLGGVPHHRRGRFSLLHACSLVLACLSSCWLACWSHCSRMRWSSPGLFGGGAIFQTFFRLTTVWRHGAPSSRARSSQHIATPFEQECPVSILVTVGVERIELTQLPQLIQFWFVSFDTWEPTSKSKQDHTSSTYSCAPPVI